MCVLVGVGLGTAARGRPAAVHLLYQADPRIPDCPDITRLKRAVEERVGMAPWDPDAERQVRVRLAREGDERRASIEIRDSKGNLLGRRVLTSRRTDCRELAEAMALAISIAIDPLNPPRPLPSSRPATNPATQLTPASRPAARADATVRASGRRRHLVVTFGVGGSLAVGAAPAPAGSVSAHLGVRWRFLSASAEGRIDFPAFEEVPGGRISTWLAGGSIITCGHYRRLMGCGVVTTAALTASGHELRDARSTTRLYAGAGARGGVELPLLRWLALAFRADVLFPFALVHVVDSKSGTRFWSTAAASGTFGIDLIGTYW